VLNIPIEEEEFVVMSSDQDSSTPHVQPIDESFLLQNKKEYSPKNLFKKISRSMRGAD